MTDEERDNLLLSMKDQLDLINSKLNQHDEEFKFMHSKFEEHDENFKFMYSKFDNYDNQFESIHDEIRSLSRSIARIEINHGSMLEVLLDGHISILEKLDSFEKRFESDEADLEDHSNRIWNLESKLGIV